ncbi:3-dehydroquinate synthase [Geomicrobium sp. JSM 1781026]|uniref:3-dehydroquinate synthase n=1 Tax=Geomicrobium sp. JSM 1781026 TaxID=3344580 RepID=UPI0035C1B756
MEVLDIVTDSKTYPIYIGEGVTEQIGDLLVKQWGNDRKRLFILTDETVGHLHLDTLEKRLGNFSVTSCIISAGEASKSLDTYSYVLDEMFQSELDRNSAVIAFGGGVVGDLAGFCASTYMRGISFVQVPTTLLAHDSSVGGKTGINHPHGKNLIGSFHQPDLVIYDTRFLRTMPDREWRSGFGEVIKHGYIHHYGLLGRIEKTLAGQTEWQIAEQDLADSIRVKANIVSQDEKERGVRAFLNFGHTLGHSLEASSGFGKLSHGEAVVIGIIFALFVSKQLYSRQVPDAKKEKERWQQCGYRFDQVLRVTTDELVEKMKYDKKNKAGHIGFVVLEKLGKPQFVQIPVGKMRELIDNCKEDVFSD